MMPDFEPDFEAEDEEIRRSSLESEEYIHAMNVLLIAELGEIP